MLSPAEIKFRLEQKGLSQAKLARRWRRSKMTVNHLIHGRMKSKMLLKKLAGILDVDPSEIPQPDERKS